MARTGLVIWITGLPAVGKTRIAQALATQLRNRRSASVVLLDGDEFRTALGIAARFQPEERLALAQSYGRLCRLFAQQGHTTICATVSMFNAVREENRDTCPAYFEVFVEASDAVRETRKPVLAAAPAEDRVTTDNPQYQLPRTPDLVLANNGDQSPDALARSIVDRLLKSKHRELL